jgi:hypothetical protein
MGDVNRDQYRLVANHPLRAVLQSVTVDARGLPGKAALREQIAEAIPDEGEGFDKLRAALFTKALQFAEEAQDPRRRFELRGKADRLVLEVAEGLRDADRLVPAREEEPVDVDDLAIDSAYADRIGGDLDRKHDEERAEARELLRKAGYST